MQETGYHSTIPLAPISRQEAHKEFLTQVQVDEAKAMGINSLTTKNTQYDLLRLVKFQKSRKRETDKFMKNLAKKHGRVKAKQIIKNRRAITSNSDDV